MATIDLLIIISLIIWCITGGILVVKYTRSINKTSDEIRKLQSKEGK